jgi:Flp pilus assembly pilin Flp
MAEYTVILAFIAVAAVVTAWQLFGTSVVELFQPVIDAF